jgi:hypothetical protein
LQSCSERERGREREREKTRKRVTVMHQQLLRYFN